MQHDGAFRDGRRGGTSIARILSDPFACATSALVTTDLILADGDREPAVSSADKAIAHETFDRADDLFHFRLVFLDNVKELFRAFAGIVSHDRMHDIPPTLVSAHRISPSSRAHEQVTADAPQRCDAWHEVAEYTGR